MTYRTVMNQTTDGRGGRADGPAIPGRHVVSITEENQSDMVARLEDNREFIGGATTAPWVFKSDSHIPFGELQHDPGP